MGVRSRFLESLSIWLVRICLADGETTYPSLASIGELKFDLFYNDFVLEMLVKLHLIELRQEL